MQTKPVLNNNPHVADTISKAITAFNKHFNTNYTPAIIPPITRNNRLSRARGRIILYTHTKEVRIELNSLLSNNLDSTDAKQTILHELSHFFEFYHFNETPAHGNLFKLIATILGIPAETKSSYSSNIILAEQELAQIKHIIKNNLILAQDKLFIVNCLNEAEKRIFFSLDERDQQDTIKETYYATMKSKIERKYNVKL